MVKLNEGVVPHEKGVAAGKRLFFSVDVPAWRRHEASVPAVLQQDHHTVLSSGSPPSFTDIPAQRRIDTASGHLASHRDLLALYLRLSATLPGAVELGSSDLLQVVSFKHSFMQWRPNLAHFTGECAQRARPCREAATSDGDVRRASRAALAALRREGPAGLRGALEELSAIHGASAATASLVCAFAAPQTACFYCDELLSVLDPRGFIPRERSGAPPGDAACALAQRCREKAHELNLAEARATYAGAQAPLPQWTANSVAMAVWAAWQLGARAP
jgi:hypothetical protein